MVKKENGSKKLIIGISSALVVALLITIFSSYISSFAKAAFVYKVETRINTKIVKNEKKILVLETNYNNIITHLTDIKKEIKKK